MGMSAGSMMVIMIEPAMMVVFMLMAVWFMGMRMSVFEYRRMGMVVRMVMRMVMGMRMAVGMFRV